MPVSSIIPLIRLLTCVSGSAYTTQEATDGRESTLNSVPHRNVIGTMTSDENMFSRWVLLVTIPAKRPRSENMSDAATTTSRASGSRLTSGDMMCPTTISREQLRSPLTTPDMHFPNTIAEMCTGQSRSSSKLM